MVPATSRPAEQLSWLDVMAQCARAETVPGDRDGTARPSDATGAEPSTWPLVYNAPFSRIASTSGIAFDPHPICRTYPIPRTTRSRDTRETL
jgi:hypothetical protein